MTESLSWQIGLALCLIAVGTECILRSASLPKYYRGIRAHLVNFFLFLSLSSAAIAALSAIFRKQTIPGVMIGLGIAAAAAMIFTIIWLVPPKDSNQAAIQNSTSRALRGLFFNFLFSAIMFGMPLILCIHVYKYGDYYLDNLRVYQDFLVRTSTPAQARLELAPATAPVKYFQAVDLHFLSNTKLQCAQSDSECVKIQNLLYRSQNNRLLFLAKLFFYFVSLYLVFRFYGLLIELRYKRKPRIPGDLGLQSDVV